MLTYHTEIKHNFYAFTPIKENNMNFLQFFHGQNGSFQCMQSSINIGQGFCNEKYNFGNFSFAL